MRRCPACGAFFEGDLCLSEHEPEGETPPPLLPEPFQGEWTTYILDGEEYPALRVAYRRVVVFGPGENGHVGVYTLGDDYGG